MKKIDLFLQTQKKLTFTYTWLIVLFLVLFSVIVSVFFMGFVYQEQRQDILSALYATENGRVVVPDLAESRSEDLYFFYILNNRGGVVAGSEAFPTAGTPYVEQLARWHPNRDEFRLEWNTPSRAHHDIRKPKERERLLFLGARPVVAGDGRPAAIYAAKDVTFYFEVFQNLLLVFLFILVFFVIAAVWLSYSMSKKAMIPIQQAYKQQQQFLADASHELRTPLSIMNTSLDVIEMENGEDLTSFSKEVMSDLKEEVGRMSGMVQHLLILARSDSGAVEFEMVSFDLVPKIRQWVQSFEAVAHTKHISLQAELPDQMTVRGDIERIKQVVYILLDNAIKYTPEDGKVELTLGQNPTYWSLSIRDTGIGIPEDEQPRIFDRFYRVQKHRSREEGSAGLGLSIAKWIIDSHQGSIEVESAVGKGSRFIVKFPNL